MIRHKAIKMDDLDLSILNIFPTPVGKMYFNREFSKEELEFIDRLDRRNSIGNDSTKNTYVLRESPLKSIHDFLLDSTIKFFNQVCKPKDDVKIYITQSWINYTHKNQYHHLHNHSNSFFSGVFYINANNSNDCILFHTPKEIVLKVNPTELNPYNSESWWLEAKTGILYLFPSTLRHSVPLINDENFNQTRVSLSFNTFLTGTMGENTAATELILADPLV